MEPLLNHSNFNGTFLDSDPHTVTAACDASISAHFILDPLASAHANTHDLSVRDARIALGDHNPDPNGK